MIKGKIIPFVPLEPKPRRNWSLSEGETATLRSLVIFGSNNPVGAYLYGTHDPASRSLSMPAVTSRFKQLLALDEAHDYMKAYKATVIEALGLSENDDTEESGSRPLLGSEIVDAKMYYKQKMDSLTRKAIDAIEDMFADPDQAKDAVAAFNRIAKQFDTEDEHTYPAIRYLPEMCSTCRCKKFVEDECVDFCKQCRYKKYANENDVVYSDKDMLEGDGA